MVCQWVGMQSERFNGVQAEFFDNRVEEVLAADNSGLQLLQQEKFVLVLDKITTMNGKVLTKAEWQKAFDGLKICYIKLYVIAKAYERENFGTTGIAVSGLLLCTLFVYYFFVRCLDCYVIFYFSLLLQVTPTEIVDNTADEIPLAYDDAADIVDIFSDEPVDDWRPLSEAQLKDIEKRLAKREFKNV